MNNHISPELSAALLEPDNVAHHEKLFSTAETVWTYVRMARFGDDHLVLEHTRVDRDLLGHSIVSAHIDIMRDEKLHGHQGGASAFKWAGAVAAWIGRLRPVQVIDQSLEGEERDWSPNTCLALPLNAYLAAYFALTYVPLVQNEEYTGEGFHELFREAYVRDIAGDERRVEVADELAYDFQYRAPGFREAARMIEFLYRGMGQV